MMASFHLGIPVGAKIETDIEQKHAQEFEWMTERVKRLDLLIKDFTQRIARLHRKRSKMANTIIKYAKRTKITEKHTEAANVRMQNERIKRLDICSNLLGNRVSLSSISKNKPLPDLLPAFSEETIVNAKGETISNCAGMTSIAQFLRNSKPDIISNYMNDTAIVYMTIMEGVSQYNDASLVGVDVKAFTQAAPTSMCAVNPPIRQMMLRYFFNAMKSISGLFGMLEDTFDLTDLVQLSGLIESSAASLVDARRARLFIAGKNNTELIHLNGNVRVVVPLGEKGLINNCVQTMKYRVVQDPKGDALTDIAVEGPLFEGCKNCIICPIKHPNHKSPYVICAMDKLKGEGFCANDYLLLKEMFELMLVRIEDIQQSVNELTEVDQTNLIKGIASIAGETTSHGMIQKITEIGNMLTSATVTRVFSIIDDNLCEETPGVSLQSKMVPVDMGLTGKAVVMNDTMNYVMPRREPEFSVQVDDITEPRVWAMMTAPAMYHGDVSMVMTIYNRQFNTFFSAKERLLISTLAKCVCPFLYQSCELCRLSESLASDSGNSNRAYNLTVFSLKAIETAGTTKMFREMKRFCEMLKPQVAHRIFMYDIDKLILIPDMKVISSEPQLLDAIMTMKPAAATVGNKAVVVFPIKVEGIKKLFLLEFSAEMLQLKTAEEENGILQRSRLIQALNEAGQSENLASLRAAYNNANGPIASQLYHSGSRVSFGGMSARGNRSAYGSTQDLTLLANPKVNLPFIPLSLKSIHESNMSSTSLFELSDDSRMSSDKLIIVQSSRNQKANRNSLSFENQLDEDSLQIFPFDPFLTSILQSFSNLAARQVLLHMNICSMNKYRITARSLHILGNSLACPLPFSGLLEIMMIVFNNLFGKGVKIKIFDPPLSDACETDPMTFNLERDRLIFAAIKIPSALTLEKSTVLSCFADLLTNLIESRAESGADPIGGSEIPEMPHGFDFDISRCNVSEMVTLATSLFSDFHIPELLNADMEKVAKWIGSFATKSEDSGLFLCMVDALYEMKHILETGNWWDSMSVSELVALALYAFLGQCFPQMHPQFKYEKLIASCITKKTPQRNITKVATILVLLADDACDLLENTPPNVLIGLIEIMLESNPLPQNRSVFYYRVLRQKLDLENALHKATLRQFLIQASSFSMYFAPITAFTVWVVTYGKEPLVNLLLKAQTFVNSIVEELVSSAPGFEYIRASLKEKIQWIENQEGLSHEQQEEEDDGNENLSLADAQRR